VRIVRLGLQRMMTQCSAPLQLRRHCTHDVKHALIDPDARKVRDGRREQDAHRKRLEPRRATHRREAACARNGVVQRLPKREESVQPKEEGDGAESVALEREQKLVLMEGS